MTLQLVEEETSWQDELAMDILRDHIADIKDSIKTPMPNHDDPMQQFFDNILEGKITELGSLIALEAERRICYTAEGYRRHHNELAARSVPFAEELEKVSPQYGVLYEQYKNRNFSGDTEIEGKFSSFRKTYDELTSQAYASSTYERKTLEALVKAYREILGELRPLGGTIKTHSASDEIAVTTLQNTVGKYYPSDWIEASNNFGDLVVKEVDSRAMYSFPTDGVIVNEKGIPRKRGWISLYSATVQNFIDIMSKDGDPVCVDSSPTHFGINGLKFLVYYQRFPFDATIDIMDEDGIPLGEGWYYGHVMEGGNTSLKKNWYRHKYTEDSDKEMLQFIPHIEMTSSYNENWISPRVAYHEFVHRAEHVSPDHLITRMEEAFYRRRTTRNGKQNPLELLRGEEKDTDLTPDHEYIREGNFVDPYVGRQYPFGKMQEILSVGAEGIFESSYGSLMGFKGWKADEDHRNFTLGVFAVC